MKLKRGLSLAVMATTLLLVGCSDKNVKSIKALTLEEVSGSRLANMTQEERDGVVFKYLTNSIIVDDKNLIAIDAQDFKIIEGAIKGVHDTLKGKDVRKIDGKPYLNDNFANYLLFEFTKTPFDWKHTSTTPVGFDASTRTYFIDVNYETTQSLKYVIPSSGIPSGIPAEDIIKSKRYNDYITYLSLAAKGDMESATPVFNQFKKSWGSIDTILEEQDTRTLIERVRENPTKQLGGVTYTGVVQDPTMTQPAKMTVRYILQYDYNLGEETTINIKKVYLKSYELLNTENYINAENLALQDETQGLSVIEPYIKRTLNSFEKAVSERNHVGLYSLMEDYGLFDKYINAYNKYLYNWSSNFNFRIIEKRGTDLKVLVEREKNQRGKYTYMSMPTYKETLLYTLVLSDNDKVKIKSQYLLKSELVGEPNSVVKNITGTSADMKLGGQLLTKDNEEKVVQVTKDFMQSIFENDTNSTRFTDIVDMGVSQNVLLRIYDNVGSIGGASSKINYMTWETKSNVYVSLRMREVFLKTDHNIDTESIVELVNRNGDWYVINYTRTMSVKTKAGRVTDTKNILSENTPEGSIDREEIKTSTDTETVTEEQQNIEEDEEVVEQTKPTSEAPTTPQPNVEDTETADIIEDNNNIETETNTQGNDSNSYSFD